MSESAEGPQTGRPPASPAAYAPRVRSVACRQCRARKTKCSGGRPCTKCRQANQGAGCVYPQKDRLVKVSQRYVDELLTENQELRGRDGRTFSHEAASAPPTTDSGGSENHEAPDTEPSPYDTEVSSAPWFVDIAVLHTPILLAEASDSAFATRFRQSMSSAEQGHLPRVSYPSENHLQVLSESACKFPSLPEARLLINASLQGLGRWHHMVRRSTVLKELEQVLQDTSDTHKLRRSKFWALFAIGKMHATRTTGPSRTFPGLEYFAKATDAIKDMSERPTLVAVETCLLLSYYSLCLNRRHSAYSLAGLAVRTGVIMGLHLDVPTSLLPDPAVREHRRRVWWTAYIFDRMWATKIGYPATIQDDDIGIGMPSDDFKDDDFADPTYLIAMLGLARISGQIIKSIYGRNIPLTPLSQRVNDCLQALRKWLEQMPPSLNLHSNTNEGLSQTSASLHLLFNQLTILATRPVLLHVFRTQRSSDSTVPGPAKALCDTCIRCARNSHQILMDAWFSGSFMLFDYFYTQNLFLTAVILAISSLLNDDARQLDLEHFDALSLLLSQLKESGNFVAAEFKQHLDTIKPLVHEVHAEFPGNHTQYSSVPGGMDPSGEAGLNSTQLASRNMANDVAASSALPEAFFYDLLSQPLPDLDFIDASLDAESAIGFY